MTVILPQEYHARRWLESHRISCITQDEALRQDIRALRIGLIDLTPERTEATERLLQPLGRSIIHIEPVLVDVGLENHLGLPAVSFEEANAAKTLDGLLVTGRIAPDEPYVSPESVPAWDRVKPALDFARTRIVGTLGISLGGVAVAHALGIKAEAREERLDGVFRSYGINRTHPICGDLDDEFDCPQRRLFHIDESVLRYHEQRGHVSLLADSDVGGFFLFGTPDYRMIAHLGDPAAKAAEYGREDNTWRSHRNELFTSWIKYLYLANDY